MRKLASIQTVNAVEPIPNADAIEKIRVLGWWVVVKKGEHRPGDKVVYCEIDSLLPERPEFEFLRASSFKPAQTDAAGRCRPAGRVPHQDGQAPRPGVAGHLLPAVDPAARRADRRGSGRHRRCSASASGSRRCRSAWAGKVKGGFPGFLPKTDETRVQVLEPVLRAAPRQDVLRHREARRHVVHRVPPAGRVRHLQPEPLDGRGRRDATSWSASPAA